MDKKFVVLLTVVFILSFAGAAFSADEVVAWKGPDGTTLKAVVPETGPSQGTGGTTDATVKAVDAGNKVCPVMGNVIDEKYKATYEYKGKIYNFCCPMCIEEFKKDLEKYIKIVEEELAKEKAKK